MPERECASILHRQSIEDEGCRLICTALGPRRRILEQWFDRGIWKALYLCMT